MRTFITALTWVFVYGTVSLSMSSEIVESGKKNFSQKQLQVNEKNNQHLSEHKSLNSFTNVKSPSKSLIKKIFSFKWNQEVNNLENDPETFFKKAQALLESKNIKNQKAGFKGLLSLYQYSKKTSNPPSFLEEVPFLLGNACFSGLGVTQNLKEAIGWYTLAAEKDYIPAQIKLSEIYCSDDGLCKNSKEAVKWFKILSNNTKVDSNIRYVALETISRLGETDDKSIVFDMLMFLMSAGDDQEIQLKCAKLLTMHLPLSDSRYEKASLRLLKMEKKAEMKEHSKEDSNNLKKLETSVEEELFQDFLDKETIEFDETEENKDNQEAEEIDFLPYQTTQDIEELNQDDQMTYQNYIDLLDEEFSSKAQKEDVRENTTDSEKTPKNTDDTHEESLFQNFLKNTNIYDEIQESDNENQIAPPKNEEDIFQVPEGLFPDHLKEEAPDDNKTNETESVSFQGWAPAKIAQFYQILMFYMIYLIGYGKT